MVKNTEAIRRQQPGTNLWAQTANQKVGVWFTSQSFTQSTYLHACKYTLAVVFKKATTWQLKLYKQGMWCAHQSLCLMFVFTIDCDCAWS